MYFASQSEASGTPGRRELVGTREKLVHDYNLVDVELVWEMVQERKNSRLGATLASCLSDCASLFVVENWRHLSVENRIPVQQPLAEGRGVVCLADGYAGAANQVVPATQEGDVAQIGLLFLSSRRAKRLERFVTVFIM